MIRGHGDDGYLFKRPIVADFSSNVWHGGLPPGLQAHLQAKLGGISHYPDAGASKLQSMLEEQLRLSPGTVMVTNGGTEAIYLIAQAFSGATTTIVAPTFAEYADACRIHRHQLQYLLWEKLSPALTFSTDLVFVCNPNNSTGDVMEDKDLQQLIQTNRHTIFVIDEAYMPFTLDAASMLPHLHRMPNVLVLRSMTKTCCIPGLRLGYLAGQKHLLERVSAFRMPWSVNSLAQEAGEYILTHPHGFDIPLESLLADTFHLRNALKQFPELKVYPSRTHFFLFETLTGTAAELKAWLVEHYGLLIRDASNFYGLEQGHCRVACRNANDNQLLITALRKWTHI
ncbi:pyridoxal phosphate-dependent aminotransferase [Chitinophaga vietnamensis]|uniref:pyridoxal phosphate-dependent aminotransferase n=1 Tax=Chitinophaga vietnamensis TaxID=2593957 RepID=UPI001177A485|nr:aminotransferase class I/II-fold pyridoxal phosphate-dependent enzyme [Chitinophaga vietnamensis]